MLVHQHYKMNETKLYLNCNINMGYRHVESSVVPVGSIESHFVA